MIHHGGTTVVFFVSNFKNETRKLSFAPARIEIAYKRRRPINMQNICS